MTKSSDRKSRLLLTFLYHTSLHLHNNRLDLVIKVLCYLKCFLYGHCALYNGMRAKYCIEYIGPLFFKPWS